MIPLFNIPKIRRNMRVAVQKNRAAPSPVAIHRIQDIPLNEITCEFSITIPPIPNGRRRHGRRVTTKQRLDRAFLSQLLDKFGGPPHPDVEVHGVMPSLDSLAENLEDGKVLLPQGWAIDRSKPIPALTLAGSMPWIGFEGLERILRLKVSKGWGLNEPGHLDGYGRYELETEMYTSGLTLQLEASSIHPMEVIDYMQSVYPQRASEWQSLRDTWQELKTSRYWEKDEYRDASRYRICDLVQTYIEHRLLEAKMEWATLWGAQSIM